MVQRRASGTDKGVECIRFIPQTRLYRADNADSIGMTVKKAVEGGQRGGRTAGGMVFCRASRFFALSVSRDILTKKLK
jgi:hypothetical protein